MLLLLGIGLDAAAVPGSAADAVASSEANPGWGGWPPRPADVLDSCGAAALGSCTPAVLVGG